jgi:hypothetical protein
LGAALFANRFDRCASVLCLELSLWAANVGNSAEYVGQDHGNMGSRR